MVTEQPVRIGRYEIVRRLGRSMTDVYLALDGVENRKVALKIVRMGGDRTSQLIIEAERRGAGIQRQMQALDPRVVEIYEIGEQDGYFFVAMQYVEGRNLASILREDHVVPATRAAVIALEVCEQLVKFHCGRTAVVHGDIKPSNILLGVRDTVRLLDFGIAKTLRADGSPTAHNFGSPSYCSPERLSRSEVDQQSDLWAVGATLYEMLTGKPPYQAGNTRKLEGIIRSKRPPGAIPPACPRGLRFITMKALAPTAAITPQSKCSATCNFFWKERPLRPSAICARGGMPVPRSRQPAKPFAKPRVQ
jgi:eukaryotic-like serine/threonine-protein kinase